VADKKNNNEPFKVVRSGQLTVVPSQEIEVGEVVYIANGQHFPADFVLLASSSDDGICYVGIPDPVLLSPLPPHHTAQKRRTWMEKPT
jgi:hypothetical protein